MKVKEIRDLIDFISASGLEEVNIETEEFKIRVKRNAESLAAPVMQAAPSAPAATAPPSKPDDSGSSTPAESKSSGTDESKFVTIKSPMIGTFYRSPNPESDSFVNVGDTITAGDPVCIIEAMKLFNEIETEVSGTIYKVLVDNASPVEYDQPLFLVDPS